MKKKIIISGGGTGGHIFPAISIANALKKKDESIEILFIGASKRMEMERVPHAGYKIIGLPVMGFDRANLFNNFKVIRVLFKSLRKARKIIKDFKPQVVVGVGGYASGPTLRAAAKLHIPTLIQEQNSYAGVTNKLLSRKVKKICVAYPNMEKFFPSKKIILTGNPVRQDLLETSSIKKEAYEKLRLNPNKKTILIVGGSLGARTLNDSVMKFLDKLEASDIQIVWQTGKYYYESIIEKVENRKLENIRVVQFIPDMRFVYAVADLVISRAGAGSISEFSLLKKAVILVPSPNVAEDHQTKNAMSLVNQGAAVLVKDKDAREELIPKALSLINKEEELNKLSENIYKLAKHNSADIIANEILKLVKN